MTQEKVDLQLLLIQIYTQLLLGSYGKVLLSQISGLAVSSDVKCLGQMFLWLPVPVWV